MCSAALTGGFIDKIAETKGMDAVDAEKAKLQGWYSRTFRFFNARTDEWMTSSPQDRGQARRLR